MTGLLVERIIVAFTPSDKQTGKKFPLLRKQSTKSHEDTRRKTKSMPGSLLKKSLRASFRQGF